KGDNGVADELLDRAAVTLELVPQPCVVRREQGADVLGIELLRPRREANQIREQDRDDLPLLVGHRRRGVERGCAGAAELEAGRVLLAASRAGLHALSI